MLSVSQMAVATAAMLGAFGSALLVKDTAGLTVNAPILAVVLAVTLGRARLPGGATGLAVVAVTAVAAAEVGSLLHTRPNVGDALFVAGISLTIWVRRFGPAASRAGTVAAMPFVGVLVAPPPVHADGGGPWWSALIALISFGWVWLCHDIASRTGLLVRPVDDDSQAEPPSPRASTRMAVQMAVALAGAFAAGRLLFAPHWAWPVLTAFIVCSGNRGRGDVVHKSGHRLVGAAAGTVAATTLAGTLPPRGTGTVVLILAVLAVAIAVRPFGYAYWAGCVTAALALLYGYFGQSGTEVLVTRLEGIVAGAVIGVAASWFVLPIRSIDVFRKRAAEVRAALLDLAAGLREDDAGLDERRWRFEHAVRRLDEVAGVFLARRRWGGERRPADLVDTVHGCVPRARAAEAGSPDAAAELDRTARALGAFLLATRPTGTPRRGPRR